MDIGNTAILVHNAGNIADIHDKSGLVIAIGQRGEKEEEEGGGSG